MKTILSTILVATCVLSGDPAAAGSTSGPDFVSSGARPVDTSLAASDARTSIDPLDVIPFDFDSSALDVVSKLQLRAGARWLAAHPDYRLVVASHTDAAGSKAYNVGLAARRARAVYDELVASGAEQSRVVLIIYGEAARRSRAPYAAANRVAELYATRLPPRALARATLGTSTAILWANPRSPRVALDRRISAEEAPKALNVLRDEALGG